MERLQQKNGCSPQEHSEGAAARLDPGPLYHIQSWGPSKLPVGAWGFSIVLFPSWKDRVSRIPIENRDFATSRIREYMQIAYEYPNSHEFRLQWGEWGPEHISVPGNACGLDLDRSHIGGHPQGAVLSPHNIDSIHQASMLLSMFLFVADFIVGDIIEEVFDEMYKQEE